MRAVGQHQQQHTAKKKPSSLSHDKHCSALGKRPATVIRSEGSFSNFRERCKSKIRKAESLKREILKSRKDSKSLFRFQSASIVFHSAGLNLTAAAATFSSRCATDDVPGIGSITGDRCRSQARAS